MKNLFEISSEEKNRILGLHESATKSQYLINEQKINPINFNITDSFPSGKFTLNNTDEIDDAINKIIKYVKSGKGSLNTIVINSSESKVPNRGVGLKPGELSKLRASEVEKYIKSKLGDSVNIKINNLGAQGPDWNPSKGKDNPDYTKYQYVTLDLSAQKCNFTFKGGGTQGLSSNNYITANEPDTLLYDKGTLTLDSGSIPDRMVVIDNSGKITQDTGYIATQKHQYSEYKYVPIYVSTLTELNNSVAVSGNKLKLFTVQNDFKELLNILLINPSKYNEKDVRREIKEGIENLKNQFNKGVRTFVLYDDVKSLPIPFDTNLGDKKFVIYSPLGNTGYSVTGKC
jgi:hypothetical protein